jgi:TolB-like protein/Tfp pilus assembly protein PilF
MDLSRLIADLKRRRVFRVAAVYVVVGWVCIQIADATFPHLGLPEWMIRAVIIVVLLGLPIAIVLAWAYDITPEGVKHTDAISGDDASRAMSPASTVSARSSFQGGRAAAQIGVGIVIALAAFGAYAHYKSSDPASQRAKIDSVAVLPFVDRSAAHDQEYFSDGISEELLNALSKVQGLRVPGRTSSFQFKGKNTDARTIGSQLGVVALLEGSVQKVGDKVRINTQLTDATTGDILWSGKYDRQLTDIFAVQDEITHAIVDALKLQMAGRPGADAPVAAATSISAHDAYLIGLYKLNRRTRPMLREAAVDFQKAVAADPKYVAAYAALADAYGLLPQYGEPFSAALADTARDYAQQALRLDPNSAEAHAALGTIYTYLDWKFADAERELKLAIALNPNYATAHQWYGELLVIVNRADEGVRELRRAVALDPLSPLQHGMLGRALDARGDSAAEIEFKEAIRLDSTFQRSYGDLGGHYMMRGAYEQAAALSAMASRIIGSTNDSAKIMQLRGLSTDPERRAAFMDFLAAAARRAGNTSRAIVGIRYAYLGNPDLAFEAWNKAVDVRDSIVLWIPAMFRDRPIARDPRFVLLMKRIGL